ncbi:hypothetical protein GCM10011403_15750 [Pseudohongiella nitratireducens]|uniref:Thioredoxin domain-containing protein n=1 Tax=Pseudohongiella nitratireducens TaxID=1768907 RepID=A0A917GWB4_9GAMM|nr:hypothetical protein [Pseudohongiella nitratireducens]GGG59225.1 hypothetical protein GCM10011403_15750 [Pseudohongiella nitratireducens]
MSETRTTKMKLAFLLLIAFVPITLASFAYRAATDAGMFSGETVNNGILINPPVDISELALEDEQNDEVFLTFDERIADIPDPDDYETAPWLILYVNNGSCGDSCRERVHLLRQMHVTLNKNMPRVRRYYVQSNMNAVDEALATHFREEFPSMGIVQGEADKIAAALAPRQINLDPDVQDIVFFVDPVGNVMMYYTDEHEVADIKEDLVRLLRLSSLG